MDKECGKLSESVKTLRRDTQQQIESVSERTENVTESMNEKIGHASESLNEWIVRVTDVVNDKIDQLNECLNERLALHLSEAKKGQEKLRKELENKTRDILAKELASSRQRVTEENLNTAQESVEAASRSSDSRRVEISSRLDRIQKQTVAISSSQTVNHSTVEESMEPGVCSTSLGLRSTSTPAENFGNLRVQENGRMTDECALRLRSHSDHSDNVPAVSVAIGNASSDVSHSRELAELSQFQCPSSILNGIVLPKFHDCHKLAELEDYHRLKRVPETLKLPIAMKAISDSYSKQLFTAVYQDLTSYDHSRKRSPSYCAALKFNHR
jgi:hypothetical protein